jgi:ferritin-like metal-binding protein YciE
MTIKTLHDLFVHELSDVYSAEKQMSKALPGLARAATNEHLTEAFETHLEETREQIHRIDQIVDMGNVKLKRIKCVAMEGLVEESKDIISGVEKGAIRDAALIGGAQKVEHYEIASYGTLCALAKKLGLNEELKLLLVTLEEEKNTDEKLTHLAKSETNPDAAAV